MQRIAVLTAIALLFCAGAALAAPQPEERIDGELQSAPQPSPSFNRPEIQVLLSSIDMTVSLIDAYGRCREEPKGHEECMTIIRSTLDHARSMIGH